MTGRDNTLLSRLSMVASALAAFFLVIPAAHAATLIGVSSVSAIQVGETVPIEWYLDTEGKAINAVELALAYSKDTVTLDAEPGRSLISLWVERPVVHADTGVVSLTGGVPGGVRGVIPLFRTKVTGVHEGPVAFALPLSAKAYLHDGEGTPEAISLPPFQLSVVAPVAAHISSPTHPDQNVWSHERDATFVFAYDSTKRYSYTFTKDFTQFPDATTRDTNGSVSYTNLVDGIYYFRLAEVSLAGAIKDAGVFRVQIDATPPELFTPVLATSTDLFAGAPLLSWTAVDKTSGISRYTVRSGLLGFAHEAVSPYRVSRPLVGDTIRIRAYDTAGNEREVLVTYKGYIPVWLFFTLLALLVVLIVVYVRYSRRRQPGDMTISFKPKHFGPLALLLGALLFPNAVSAATMYVSPATGTYAQGSTFSVSLRVDTAGEAINTGEATLSYSTDTLEVVGASQGATFSLPTPGSPQRGAGTVYFGGGIPTPGYTGSAGLLGTIVFRVKAVGVGTASIGNAKTLLNDGYGTDAFKGASGGRYTLVAASPAAPVQPGAPTVSSATHPDQNAWYVAAAPSFIWALPIGADAVSYELDQIADTKPDTVPDAAQGNTKAYERVADGVWYFHIRARFGTYFGPTTHYRVQIDTTPPEKFGINTAADLTGTPTITFETTDALSGIARYDVKVDTATIAENATSPLVLSTVSRGRHGISVIAYDHAGNAQEAHITLFVDKQIMVSLTFIILLLILNLLITILLLILIWLEINDRKRRDPASARVKRAQHDIDERLEKLREHVREELESMTTVPAKDLLTKEKTAKDEVEGMLAGTRKGIDDTVLALGNIPDEEPPVESKK